VVLVGRTHREISQGFHNERLVVQVNRVQLGDNHSYLLACWLAGWFGFNGYFRYK